MGGALLPVVTRRRGVERSVGVSSRRSSSVMSRLGDRSAVRIGQQRPQRHNTFTDERE